jgi:hypothetical protein
VAEVLTAAEQRRLRTWRAGFRWAVYVSPAICLAAIVLTPGPQWVSLVVLAAVAVGLVMLGVMSARCPRCHRPLAVPDPSAEDELDHAARSLDRSLPSHCQYCGVGLGVAAPDAEPGAAADPAS